MIGLGDRRMSEPHRLVEMFGVKVPIVLTGANTFIVDAPLIQRELFRIATELTTADKHDYCWVTIDNHSWILVNLEFTILECTTRVKTFQRRLIVRVRDLHDRVMFDRDKEFADIA